MGVLLDNIKLVYYVCNKFKNCIIDYEDLVSIGTYGLLKAQKTYNGSYKFSTYAHKCIENEILMNIRKEKRYYGNKSNFDIMDIAVENDNDTDILYKQVINSIPDEYRYIVPILRKEKTLLQTSNELNISIRKIAKQIKYIKNTVKNKIS
jgi:RNA polymerase sigma factor (sigma-70 family)